MAWQRARRGELPPRWSDQYIHHDREVKPETLAYLYGTTGRTVLRWAQKIGVAELRWPPTPQRRDYRYPRGCRRCWYVIRAENLPRIHMLFLPELQTRGALKTAGIDPGRFRYAPRRRRLEQLSKNLRRSYSLRFITRSTALSASLNALNDAPATTPPSRPTTPPAG